MSSNKHAQNMNILLGKSQQQRKRFDKDPLAYTPQASLFDQQQQQSGTTASSMKLTPATSTTASSTKLTPIEKAAIAQANRDTALAESAEKIRASHQKTNADLRTIQAQTAALKAKKDAYETEKRNKARLSQAKSLRSSTAIDYLTCDDSKEWFDCPVAVGIFVTVVALLSYCVYMMLDAWRTISNMEKDYNEKDIKEAKKVFTLNLVGFSISFAILMGFLSRAIPHTMYMSLVNKYSMILSVAFLAIITGWNLFFLYGYEDKHGKQNKAIKAITMSVFLITVIMFIIMSYTYAKKYLDV
jgi:hypothetical protein